MMKDRFIGLQEILGYRFQNEELLTEALTHPTFAYESQKDIADNQRLEFLGDSILGMVVAEYLYKKYSNSSEGELTQSRSLLVNKNNLADRAKELDLPQYLLLGKGEAKMDGGENLTNLSGALEAIIGAIYIDGGVEATKKFIIQKLILTQDIK